MGALAAVALLGAGCAQEPAAPAAPETNTPVSSSASNTPIVFGEPKELPPTTELAQPIDDSAWITNTMKSGIVLKTPTKTTYTPTSWTYTLLASDDAHLQGDCYMTENTVYAKTAFNGRENVCQTTTELNDGPSERTDYFVFHTGKQTQLFTFVKKYPAGFDMNAYGATIAHIIDLIK